MKYANWNVPERGAEIPRALLAAGCTPLLAAILHLRGLSDPAAARSFLRGGAETLTNPLELTGMVDAVQRLTRAVATGEHVAVYGDYDVDGITAACLLTDYLRFRGLTCELYIPDRIRDGYGLNTAAIDTLTEKGVTLIVTVDCGVTNLEETAYAAQRFRRRRRSLIPSSRTAAASARRSRASAWRSSSCAPWTATRIKCSRGMAILSRSARWRT